MKKIIPKIMLLFILLLTARVYSNPIAVYYLNEIKVDSGGFFIELCTNFMTSLDGWYLTSLSDTAYFKQGLALDSMFILITQDSLKDPFSINPAGDIIGLFNPDYQYDRVGFGPGENGSVAAPLPGQSINLYNDVGIEGQIVYYYLDNSPTPGSANDSLGAMGFLQGTVVDSLEKPVCGLEIMYDYKEIPPDSISYFTVKTDSSGYFILKNMAKRQVLLTKKGNYFSDFLFETQIYPEDTVTVKIYYNNLTNIKPQTEGIVNRGYDLKQNYPNPFNGSTVFSYRLPFADFVKISVFNVSGELVNVLHTGYQTAGLHKISWRPGGAVSSGLYLYRLQTSELVLHKKCLYIK